MVICLNGCLTTQEFILCKLQVILEGLTIPVYVYAIYHFGQAADEPVV